jgi:hypothetical protein
MRGGCDSGAGFEEVGSGMVRGQLSCVCASEPGRAKGAPMKLISRACNVILAHVLGKRAWGLGSSAGGPRAFGPRSRHLNPCRSLGLRKYKRIAINSGPRLAFARVGVGCATGSSGASLYGDATGGSIQSAKRARPIGADCSRAVVSLACSSPRRLDDPDSGPAGSGRVGTAGPGSVLVRTRQQSSRLSRAPLP